ncbi:MAG: Sapep family Mn(2+)-dependent dipeptidase [Oscillospiraceae bacterium]|nr:Sapep family Mn(2+)-dependent dipeptidase [Oscillospiraceae bacterium]
MDELLRKDIESFVSENEEAIFADIAKLVSFNSENAPALPGKPFGKGAAAALEAALEIAEGMGLSTENCEGMIGYAQLGEGGRDCREYLATITHLDIVPVGEGWSADPFTMRERDGWIIGRGVMDDKGPSVLCLYALKYLKEKNVPLRYPVRALLGVNEEIGMKDVEYYLENFPAPLFCFSPDANFPLCNGEKGIYHGRISANAPAESIVEIRGGFAANAIPDKAEALVRAGKLESAGRVSAEHAGERLWKLTATGVGGHASMPEGTVNAIGELIGYLLENGVCGGEEEKLLRFLASIHASSDGSACGIAADDGLFKPLTVVSGVIGMENGRLYQTVDSRYPTNMSGEKIAAILNERAAGCASVTVERDAPPFYMPLDKPEVQVCINAYNAVTGEDAKPYTIGGGTYARDFPNAVSFGPEHPERPAPDFAGPIHGVDEAACKEWFLEALKVYILALIELEKLEF